MQFGTPNTETGLSWVKSTYPAGRADIRFDGYKLTLAAGIGTGTPANTGVVIFRTGTVGIGETSPQTRLHVNGSASYTSGVLGSAYPNSNGTGVTGFGSAGTAVYGNSGSGSGVSGASSSTTLTSTSAALFGSNTRGGWAGTSKGR